MKISAGDLHNNMITPSDNGGLVVVANFVTHKVLISDTTLGLFIPSQVRKMTPKLCHILRCDIFIIPKDMQIYLNDFFHPKMFPLLLFSSM